MGNANPTQPGREDGAALDAAPAAAGTRGLGDGAPAGLDVEDGGLPPRASRVEDTQPRTPSTTNRCSATNRFGAPCKARAIERGLCAMHSGKTDPRAMGRKLNGKARMTQLRREARADDAVLGLARDEMIAALGSSDEKRRFEAATRLFSFRAQVPPVEAPAPAGGERTASYSIAGLAAICIERGVIELDGIDSETQGALVAALRRDAKRTRSEVDYGTGPPPKGAPHGT